jgi:hypothetical protein
MSDFKAFSTELVKIAAEDTSKSYASQMVATLPFALAKGAVDVPKGAVDKAVDQTIRSGKLPSLKAVASRAFSRGGATLAAGTITTPMFLGGLKDLKNSKNKSEKNKAMAKLIGSGFLYSALKGAVETMGEKGLSGVKPKDALRLARNVGSARGIIGAGSAALTARGIVQSRSGGPGKKKRPRWQRDAVTGASLGAAKGVLDELAERGVKSIKTPAGLRNVAARASGRVASGAIGAVALGKLFDSYMKKTSSDQSSPAPTPGRIYTSMRQQAGEMDTPDVYAAYSAHLAQGNPEKNPTRRAVMYALSDTLKERGEPTVAEKMRNQVSPPTSAAVAAALVVPSALVAVADRVPLASDKDLASAMEATAVSRGIEVVKKNPEDLWGQYSGGAMLDEGKILIGNKAGAETIAHEIGHLSAGPLRRKILHNPLVGITAYQSAALALAVAPAVILANLNDGSFATKKEIEQKKRTIDNLRRAGAVVMAPRLLEEGLASAKAVTLLRDALVEGGAPPAAAKIRAVARSAARLGPAFLTYTSPLMAAAILSRHLGKRAKAAEK